MVEETYHDLDVFVFNPIISGFASYSDYLNSTLDEWLEVNLASDMKSEIEAIASEPDKETET